MNNSNEPTEQNTDKILLELKTEIGKLNQTLVNSSRKTDYFTVILMVFAILQIVVGIFQFVVALQTPGLNKAAVVIVSILFGIFFFFTIRSFDRILKKMK